MHISPWAHANLALSHCHCRHCSGSVRQHTSRIWLSFMPFMASDMSELQRFLQHCLKASQTTRSKSKVTSNNYAFLFTFFFIRCYAAKLGVRLLHECIQYCYITY